MRFYCLMFNLMNPSYLNAEKDFCFSSFKFLKAKNKKNIHFYMILAFDWDRGHT